MNPMWGYIVMYTVNSDYCKTMKNSCINGFIFTIATIDQNPL